MRDFSGDGYSDRNYGNNTACKVCLLFVFKAVILCSFSFKIKGKVFSTSYMSQVTDTVVKWNLSMISLLPSFCWSYSDYHHDNCTRSAFEKCVCFHCQKGGRGYSPAYFQCVCNLWQTRWGKLDYVLYVSLIFRK